MNSPLNLMIRPATVYQFAELLSRPFTQFDAYRKGIINEEGQIVRTTGDLDGLEYIAMRVKNICKDLIPGQNKFYLSSLSGTLKLFNEEFEQMGLTKSDINIAIETFLFEKHDGDVSYLDYLIEEATVRMLTEMDAGSVGGIASPAHSNLQGGIAGIDRPMQFLIKKKKKKKKKSRKIIEQIVQQTQPQRDPYTTLQVDPMDYEEIGRATTPSGEFDPAQITTPELRKYLKRLGERSKTPVFIIGNAQQPPKIINFNRSRKP